MGLYLAVFDDNEDEIDGVEIGSYDDYGAFLSAITQQLEGGNKGAQFPLLTMRSDSDGEWSSADCRVLAANLRKIADEFKLRPPSSFRSDWQTKVAKMVGLQPKTLYDCFIDVDGEPLIERLIGLCEKAAAANRSIAFQ